MDRIVAVVNDDVVTYVELNNRLDMAVSQLRRQGTRLPPRDVLERQMLERLVMDKIQIQRAKEIGLRVDDAQLSRRCSASQRATRCRWRSFANLAEGWCAIREVSRGPGGNDDCPSART